MLIILFSLLAFRLLGFFFKIAGGVIKIIFRILIFPVLILTAICEYPMVAVIVGAIVIAAWCIEGAIKRRN